MDNTKPLGTVRASSWGDLFDCAARWKWKNLEGIRGPTRGASVVGTAVHRGTAVYDRKVLAHQIASVDEAVAQAADAIDHPMNEDGTPTEVDFDPEEGVSRGQAKDFATQLTAKYCTKVAPAMQYEAVEVKCAKLDVTTDAGVIRLSGTTDRVRIFPDGSRGIGDFKTGGKAVEGITSGTPRAVTKGHGMQLGVYTLMTEAELGERLIGPATIVGFQVNSKLHIAEGTVKNPKLPLVGTPDRPGLIELAASMLKSGVFPPNPKSVLCTRKWCPAYDLCIYHD